MKTIILAALILAGTRGMFAQDCATCQGSNTLDLTTGLTTSGTLMPMPVTVTGGVVDPYWQLINVAPPSVNGPNTGGYTISIPNTYTIRFGAGISMPTWVNIPGATALSVIQNHNFGTNNSVAAQPWRFLRKFYLCQDASVHFVVDHMGDDHSTLNIFDSNGTLAFNQNIPANNWGANNHFDTTLNM